MTLSPIVNALIALCGSAIGLSALAVYFLPRLYVWVAKQFTP